MIENNRSENYFVLFDLPQQFAINLNTLEQHYRRIQSAFHPDRFVNASATEQRQAMQQATTANEAYQTLKNPSKRAQYLLSLNGIDAIAETNTAMPIDFLMQQMQWRESIDDAKHDKDIEALDAQLSQLQSNMRELTVELAKAFDIDQHLETATELARKLIFIDKVCADIHHIIEQLED